MEEGSSQMDVGRATLAEPAGYENCRLGGGGAIWNH
jgi:hypothetical protein